MTVITLSTVGYEEVRPLSDAGRWFSVALIAAGLGTALYAASALAQFVLEGRLRAILGRRSMQRTIDALRDHVIVCGFGRLGRAVCERLVGVPVVVIEPQASLQADCESRGHLFLHGSALEDAALRRAGIERARAIVAATASDPDNVFIALSARELNPAIQIHARAETHAGIRRLQLSGATQVISPHQLGGQRIAAAILRPGVVEFLELSDAGSSAEFDLEEVVLRPGSAVENASLRDLPERGIRVTVIAIKRGDQRIRINPGGDDLLRAGDRVIAVGDRESLTRLAELATSGE